MKTSEGGREGVESACLPVWLYSVLLSYKVLHKGGTKVYRSEEWREKGGILGVISPFCDSCLQADEKSVKERGRGEGRKEERNGAGNSGAEFLLLIISRAASGRHKSKGKEGRTFWAHTRNKK